MDRRVFRKTSLVFIILLGIYMLISACSSKPETEADRKARIAQGRLTAFEIENGIGPIKEEVKVGPLDAQLAAKGEQIFNAKCTTCHKLDQKHTGPALRDVATRRSPAYILNQILNPEEMAKFHPEGRCWWLSICRL